MISLEGKTALITGASRGIGSLIATSMAALGCNLVVHARTMEALESVVTETSKQGVTVKPVSAELSDPEQLTHLINTAQSIPKPIDVLFNNAGIQVAYRQDYWTTPREDFETSMSVNLIAPAMLCYALIPGMIDRGFGRVINVTSGINQEPEQAGYSGSKAALDKITNDLASTVDGSDVLINSVDPDWCKTDLGGSSAPNEPESVIPGALVGALIDDRRSGRCFRAQDYTGMSLEEAIQKAVSID